MSERLYKKGDKVVIEAKVNIDQLEGGYINVNVINQITGLNGVGIALRADEIVALLPEVIEIGDIVTSRNNRSFRYKVIGIHNKFVWLENSNNVLTSSLDGIELIEKRKKS